MKINFFKLSLGTFILDLLVLIIGFFLIVTFLQICIFNCSQVKQSPFLVLGIVLFFIALLHFIINLIIFIYKKIKHNKKRK